MDADFTPAIAGGVRAESSNKTFARLTSRYDVEKYLGRGGVGTVVRAKRKCDGEEFAIKIVSKANLTSKSKLSLAREVVVLRELNGAENIVSFVEAFEDAKHVYIVTELCKGGDLHDRLVRLDGHGLAEAQVLKLGVQMFRALNRLHEKSICHRDIKLENWCFATAQEEEQQIIKLIDFGLCYWRRPGGELHSNVHCGTLNFASPELVRGEAYVPEESDVWSVGVVLYALVAGELPFRGVDDSRLRRSISAAKPDFESATWNKISNAFRELIQTLLAREPSARPSAADALETMTEIQCQP
eukprot:CAMPEP_0198330936 /NCGR_PEP_ID=MMETSP1450-20131203/17246_1 /TAXON_ID=753684 ORGANISM="Madagascaria erythrocladiodes, Strain CCMP3234" /NCGR_SAMPLE_ID=MMETSP1450 /ASSEMBLY_ACC=CAM_ASM_001115 /LENGTH=299 /DNA_ID=CAMNT_0044035271 /DNA_START=305 /DNA_END=1204 /DNA_ORIENTATION=+